MQNFGVKRGGGESKRRREGESKEQGGYKKDGDYLSVSPPKPRHPHTLKLAGC